MRYVFLLALPLLVACQPYAHSGYVTYRYPVHYAPRATRSDCAHDIKACPSPPPADALSEPQPTWPSY